MATTTNNPYTLRTLTATMAQQCLDANGVQGSFLFAGDLQNGVETKDREKLDQVSPTFKDTVAFFDWCKDNGWTPKPGKYNPWVKVEARNWWVIDRDLLAEQNKKDGEQVPEAPSYQNAVGLTGPRGCPEDTSVLTQRFRIKDDDGNVYYEGRMLPFTRHDEDSDGFEPLDQFGRGNAGATDLEYWQPGKGGGWKVL